MAVHASGILGQPQFDSAQHRTSRSLVSQKEPDRVWGYGWPTSCEFGTVHQSCSLLPVERRIDGLVKLGFAPHGVLSEQLSTNGGEFFEVRWLTADQDLILRANGRYSCLRHVLLKR